MASFTRGPIDSLNQDTIGVVGKERATILTRLISIGLLILLLATTFLVLTRDPVAEALLGHRTNQVVENTLPVGRVNVESLPTSSPTQGLLDLGSHKLRTSGTVSTRLPLLSGAGTSSMSIVSGFDGLNQVQSCTCVPPDVQVAAGPSHIVEMVNLEGEIFSKVGVSNKTFTLSSFFLSGSHSISDPKILFDALSGRWFSSLLDISVDSVDVAISSTSDPTGNWTIYRLSAGSFIPDQPIIGISDDKFVASANDFRSTSFVGAKYWVLNKAQMLAGVTVSTFSSSVSSGFFSIHSVQSLSPTTTQYMISNIVSNGALSASSMELFSVTGVPGISTVTTTTSVLSVSALTLPPNADQPGTASMIDTGDFRVEDALWYKGMLWYSLNDGCTPSGDNQFRSCIRLTQIDTTASPASIRQDFDYGLSGLFLFYPAMRVDGLGNLDLIYGVSSTTTNPSLWVIGQATTDPLGALGLSQSLKAGSIADTSTRYGDYFGAGLDPTDPSIVWVAGEYHSSGTGACGSFGSCWSTFIGSITINSSLPSGGARWAV
jgi:hypothetical protein